MATSTENYNFKKPDESDFYDIADENKNWDLADEALKNLDTPTFEDYTGSTAVPAATDAINQMKSKRKLGVLLSNIKAAFKGACLIGHIVNNCVTDNAGLPLSAAQGKVLKDLYTQLYSDSNRRFLIDKAIYNSLTDLPSKGSCFGVIGNAPILINDFFSIPAYSRFAFINTGDSTDGALLAIDANGDVYSAYRNNGVWNTGQVSASKSDLYSKPEYSTKYLNNESVSLKMTHDQNVLIIGHSIANGNPNGHFVYLFCAGNKTSNTGKSFKIAGDFELSYSWADGLNVSISASSSQWIQTSILYL